MATPERGRGAGGPTRGTPAAGRAAELAAELRRATMYTVLLHHATAAKSGMNVTDAQCVNALALDGPQTPGALAKLMGITTGGAITAVIDRLEKSGHVRRTRDPDDRRRVIVELVPGAAERAGRYFDPVTRQFRERLAGCTDEQVAFLLDWFGGTNAAMPAVIDEIRRMP
ncbi:MULTISPECIES: MarR family winged helix-turn-helix transcriptional regulator [Actinomadura]|uniref:MarR family winged helix-turn-helix transcriptional regulator n=1 Tax=Actinomadura TaxID=1988 RepID=UPI000425C15B|nr:MULTISPECIES: MarR family winged helix-turn-helix transcriptional regulator [Actinomadura]